MNCHELLAALEAAGIRVAAHGDRLRYSSPPEALTPDLRALIQEYKPELLRLLSPALESSSTQKARECPCCGEARWWLSGALRRAGLRGLPPAGEPRVGGAVGSRGGGGAPGPGGASLMKGEVRLSRCLLVLTEAELLSLLSHDMDLWRQALERGKALKRARAKEGCLGWSAPQDHARAGKEGRS